MSTFSISRDNFICPVTTFSFEHPIILDCGHTVDKSAAISISAADKLCPVCRRPGQTFNRVNWTIAGCLNLIIPKEDQALEAKINADMARKIVEQEIVKAVAKIDIDNIIRLSAMNRRKYCFIENADTEIQLCIMKEYQGRGFSCARLETGVKISWT